MAERLSTCAPCRKNSAALDQTETLSASAWAWEFLRRHPEFRRAAEIEKTRPDIIEGREGTNIFSLPGPVPSAESWGLRFFPDPTLPGGITPIFWSRSVYRPILSARSHMSGFTENTPFRLADIPGQKGLLLTPDRPAKLAVACGAFAALVVFDDALNAPPAALTLSVEHGGIADLDTRLRALRAFIEHCQHRFQPGPPERGFGPQRLKEALRALDGKLAGESLRQIAEALFGSECVRKDWDEGRRYTRERARRAVCRGLQLMNGGWRDLLR
jgi:hypothetical protein